MNKVNTRRAVLAFIACVAAVVVVYAVTQSQKSVKNVFTPGSVAIAIYENGTKQGSTNTIALVNTEGVLTAQKRLEIENISPNQGQDVFLRVCIVPKFMNNSQGYQIYIPHGDFPVNISGNAYTYGDVTLTLTENWSDYWRYSGGYFYYNGVVARGEKTAPLLSSVSVPSDKWQDYTSRGADLKVTVLADAIQSVGGAVENRWKGNELGFVSQDKARPDEELAQEAVALFSVEEVLTTGNAFEPPVLLTNYMLEQVMDSAVTVNVTTIYEYTQEEAPEEVVATPEVESEPVDAVDTPVEVAESVETEAVSSTD